MSNRMTGYPVRLLFVWIALSAASLAAQAEWTLPGFSDGTLSPDGLDRAFECEVIRLMDKRAPRLDGVHAVVTRFGNTIVITGQARNEAGRTRVDELVLEVAGITRKAQQDATVVPANTLACDDKLVPANTKRRSTVKPGRDCSSLRTAAGQQRTATGRVFNHVSVSDADPAQQRARAELLAAQARMALLDNAVVDAMDGNVIRLVAWQDVMYVLGRLDAGQQSATSELLERLPGVTAVQFYLEPVDSTDDER